MIATTTAPLPPGPRGWAAADTWRRFLRDPYLYPGEITAKYGDVVALPVPGMKIVLLGAPEHLNHVSVANATNYTRSDWVNAEMKPVEHKHKFFAFDEDGHWASGRAMMRPHFTKKALVDLESRFAEALSDEMMHWERYASTGETFDLQRRMKVLTVSVLMNAMFSKRLTDARLQWTIDQLVDIMTATTSRTLMWSMPARVPRPREKRGIAAQRQLDLFLTDIIAERRANPTDNTDMLNVLINSMYDDGTSLPDELILAEMVGLVIGGFDTTSASLTWTFAQIARHRDVEDKLLAELEAAGGTAITPSGSTNLAYTRACFDEAQRLQGGLIINPKVAIGDDIIGGYRIEAGTIVISSNIAIQRDPRYWPDSAVYKPERWLDRSVRRDAFVQFGRGARLCLGMHMANLEGTYTVSSAMSRYHINLAPDYELKPKYRMVVEMKGGLPVALARR